MLMYPDRDVSRNTQFAGFMIILFWRPFPTPSGRLYPWNISWDGAALNLVPALIPVIHYFLTSFLFLAQQPPSLHAQRRTLLVSQPLRFCLSPVTVSLLGSEREGRPGERLAGERLWPNFPLFFCKKARKREGWESLAAGLIESLLRPPRQ